MITDIIYQIGEAIFMEIDKVKNISYENENVVRICFDDGKVIRLSITQEN